MWGPVAPLGRDQPLGRPEDVEGEMVLDPARPGSVRLDCQVRSTYMCPITVPQEGMWIHIPSPKGPGPSVARMSCKAPGNDHSQEVRGLTSVRPSEQRMVLDP